MLLLGARPALGVGAAAVAGVAVLSALAALSASSDERRRDWLSGVRLVSTPAASSSAQPQLHSSTGGTLLSWIERQGATATLKFAERDRDHWNKAKTVASGDDWFVNWADVPSVVRMHDGTLVAHWLQKSGASPYAYDVRLSHSNDDGHTWTPSSTPHHDGTQTEHGFASLFETADHRLGVVWLDGRQTATGSGHQAGHASSSAAMTIRFATYDGAWQQTADMPIDERVCDCCPTTAAVTSAGPIVAYRNRTEDEVRDIVVSRFDGRRWTEPVAVHADGWKIAACPVNGPVLSAQGRQVVLAWFTAVGDVGHAYVAFSKDAGRTFSERIRVDDVATQGRVDVELLPDGSAVASWIELKEGRAAFMVRKLSPDGTRSAPVRVAALEGSRTSGYPRIARSGDELLFAWTDTAGGRTIVRAAVATLLQEVHE